MENWKEIKLGDVCSFQEGYVNPTQTHPEYFDGKVKWLRATDLNNSFVYETSRTLTQQGFESAGKSAILFKPDTIGISKSGTIGRLGILKDFMCGNRAVINIAPNSDVNFRFIFYVLLNMQNSFEHLAVGSVQKNLYVPILADICFNLPPLPTQQKIAQILSSLDDKIELNNKINANLEQQAQTLFKSWFVDFEPFGGEELVESPINSMIPKSLKMIQIADIPHVLETGKRPKGGAVTEGIPSIGAENVKQLGVFDYSSNKFIPEEFAIKLGKGKINGYELLLYKDGGKPGTFIPHFSMFGEGFPYEECYINEHVFKLDFGDKGLNEFAYFYFNTDYVKSWLANNGGKAAIPGINQNDVNAIWIYDLENPKVKEFGKFVEPLFKQIFSNCKQNKELASLRDTLLPKLMNGEIEV